MAYRIKAGLLMQSVPFQVNFEPAYTSRFEKYAKILRDEGVMAKTYTLGYGYRLIVWGPSYWPGANIGCDYRKVDPLWFCDMFEEV